MIWADDDQIGVFFRPDHEETARSDPLSRPTSVVSSQEKTSGVVRTSCPVPAASRSVAGVRHGPPNAPEAPKPHVVEQDQQDVGRPGRGPDRLRRREGGVRVPAESRRYQPGMPCHEPRYPAIVGQLVCWLLLQPLSARIDSIRRSVVVSINSARNSWVCGSMA